MANQFTTGKREGHDQATKDKTRAELLMQRLTECAEGTKELTSVQVAAAKVVLDKVKPSLQAIQQSQEDPFEGMTLEQLREQIKALITSRPELARDLNIGVKLVESPGSDDGSAAAMPSVLNISASKEA